MILQSVFANEKYKQGEYVYMDKMNAYVLHGPNDIHYEKVEMPKLSKKEVLVEVKAAGICGSDIPRIYKTGAHVHPLIPGHEFSGVVTALGEGADEKWLGKRVGIFPLIPCGECGPCKKKQYEMCRNYSYLGSRRDGGFADYAAVPQENLIELPDEASMEAAAMLEPMAVAVHAMRGIQVAKSDTVAICGMGTIGLLLLMFLKELGVEKLCVIGNKESQKEKACIAGICENDFCNMKLVDSEKWLMEKTEGKGVDVFFECVGKNETVLQAVNVTAPGGKVMLVGNPYSDMTLDKQIYWKILRNQLTIKGTWNSSFIHEADDDWHYVLRKLKEKKVKPEILISHTYGLEELETGLEIMRDKTEDYVKIMVRN